MAYWLHRTTKKILQNRDAADLPEPEANYVNLGQDDSVTGPLVAARVPQHYWFIENDDTLREMTQPEKDAVKAQVTEQNLEAATARFLDDPGIWRRFAEILLDEINELRADHGRGPRTLAQLRTALRSKE